MSQITTHVLDSALGKPAANVPVSLSQCDDQGHWSTLNGTVTNEDGRAPALGPDKLPAGTYRLRFETATYLKQQGQPVFYPYVEVVFSIDDSGTHYHIPLLMSPFSYSTYRGS